ncbi:MAG: Fe-S protein assembly co-chaperone HscB [Chitinophagaceae bacterium]|nr:Fe-S protein assembly co-chaperone HscB [Chitinophagaceae bacterium]
MNYFELFGLPVQLKTDKKELSARYIRLSKQYHPDYFVHADAEQQSKALDMSAMLNQAYKILQNEDETIKYVLQLKGLLEEEEKYQLPPEFLMTMMELNETVSEAEEQEQKKNISESLNRLEAEAYNRVKDIIENYIDNAVSEQELLRVKEYYFKKKYIQRLRQQLSNQPF